MDKMDVNGKEYNVIKLLGHGKGGYSYLVTDGTKEYVLKQIHHEPCDYYQFGNKIEAEKNDYECNDYMEEWNFENWGIKYWSKTEEFLEYVKQHS